jgi:hypothetical protein
VLQKVSRRQYSAEKAYKKTSPPNHIRGEEYPHGSTHFALIKAPLYSLLTEAFRRTLASQCAVFDARSGVVFRQKTTKRSQPGRLPAAGAFLCISKKLHEMPIIRLPYYPHLRFFT